MKRRLPLELRQNRSYRNRTFEYIAARKAIESARHRPPPSLEIPLRGALEVSLQGGSAWKRRITA